MRINFSKQLYHAAAYEVIKRGLPGRHGCRMGSAHTPAQNDHHAGWSAYPHQLDFARFPPSPTKSTPLLMVDTAHFAGLVAAGVHPSPVARTPTSSPPPLTRRSAGAAKHHLVQ